MWYWPQCECVCTCWGKRETQTVEVWTLVSQDRAEAAAHVGFPCVPTGIKSWVGSGNGENDQPVYGLWFGGHCCVDSHSGLVFGKGLLREMYWEREGGRIFPFCLHAESLAPANDLLVMAVYVSWTR